MSNPSKRHEALKEKIADRIYDSIHWGVPLSDADAQTRDAYLAIADEVIQIADGAAAPPSKRHEEKARVTIEALEHSHVIGGGIVWNHSEPWRDVAIRSVASALAAAEAELLREMMKWAESEARFDDGHSLDINALTAFAKERNISIEAKPEEVQP